ncbi:MAG TPA: alkaline phosphatase family protein [Actinopolymorphaceae bacterium]
MSSAIAEHVVLVDIDAFDPSYLDLAETPTLDGLIEQGAFGIACGVFKSFSTPARSTLITGAWPDVHGNQAYYYDPERHLAIGQERPYENPNATPLAAETVAQVMACEGRTVIGVDYNSLCQYGISPDDPDHLLVTTGADCVERIDVAIDLLQRRRPHLLAIYLKDVDDLGHREGPDSVNMPTLVTRLDQQIRRLVQACDAAGVSDDTVLVVVSDHGMARIAEPILPDLIRELDRTGFSWEVVREWSSPTTDADIVVVATSRNADLTLRGRAQDASREVAAAARRLGRRVVVHERDTLKGLYATDRIGDVVVEAVPPYHLSPDTGRPAGGGHGGTAEKDVALIVSGPGICPGALADAHLVDVAPTICALLGIRTPKDASGRVLHELFGE